MEKEKDKVGLLNNDNTCYMNVIIQCLYHINQLTNNLLSNCKNSKTPVLSKYINILKDFKESRKNIFTSRNGEKNYYILKSDLKDAIAKKIHNITIIK